MRATSFLAVLPLAASSFAQAVPEGIAPDQPAPDGCEDTSKRNFTIGILNLSKRETASEATSAALACTLEDGILHDPYGRTGSVVANYQFQFDGPPQAGAIYTGGFSICQNNSLALGGSTVWYRCMSGEFGNLYDRSIGDQCAPVNIVVSYVEEPGSSSSITPSSTAATSVASSKAESASGSASLSSAASASASESASATPTGSVNGTAVSTGIPSTLSSALASETASGTTAGASTAAGATGAPEAPAEGSANPTRVPRAETFGAVVGIIGAALLL